jgi:hypothetical protein
MDERDISALYLAAHSRGEQVQAYDANVLVREVADLLRERGLAPDATGYMGMATGAAGKLLRAFGIVPAMDYRALDRLNAPDPETR